MWLTGWVTWRASGSLDRTGRLLLSVGALVLAATMLLALDWALGKVTGLPHLSLSWMAATHGVANALGFALCSLLAWRREAGAGGSEWLEHAAHARADHHAEISADLGIDARHLIDRAADRLADRDAGPLVVVGESAAATARPGRGRQRGP
jgi:YndJ-like protein